MKFRFALAVALAGFTLAACGSSNDAAKPNAAAAAAPTTAAKADPAELSAWVDKVCGVRNTALAPTKPRVGILVTTADANKFKTKLVESMTTAAKGSDKAVTDLAALKSGPSPDSGKLIDLQSERLKERRAKLDETITKVQAMKTDDPAEFNTGVIQVQRDLGTDNAAVQNLASGTVDLDLADAYRAAPNCKANP